MGPEKSSQAAAAYGGVMYHKGGVRAGQDVCTTHQAPKFHLLVVGAECERFNGQSIPCRNRCEV
jgi:hypothetical protein